MTLVHGKVDTPVGPLLVVAGPGGVRAVLWPGEDGSRVRPSLIGGDDHPSARSDGADRDEAQAHLDRGSAQLAQYVAGTLRAFDVALDPVGTPFQLRAWQVLRTIPFGSTISYGAQARLLGSPGAARAVGAANGRNPIAILVPCHRVVSTGGALTGFAGGLEVKAWLLDHEQQVLRRASGRAILTG